MTPLVLCNNPVVFRENEITEVGDDLLFSFPNPVQTHCVTLQLLLKGGFPAYSLGLLQVESEINALHIHLHFTNYT